MCRYCDYTAGPCDTGFRLWRSPQWWILVAFTTLVCALCLVTWLTGWRGFR